PLDDTIVECVRDEEGRWRFMRFREDKSDANHISTVDKVLESIQDRISEEDLIRAAGSIKVAWKKRQAQAAEEEALERRRRRADAGGGGGGAMYDGVNGEGGTKRKFEE